MNTIGNTLLTLTLTLGLTFGGCGGEEDPPGAGADTNGGSADTTKADSGGADSGGADGGGGEAVVVNAIPMNVQYSADQTQFPITARLLRPVTCQAAAPCQLIVVVGDRIEGGAEGPVPGWLDAGTRLAQATGAVVVLYNLPGTGGGGMKSGGIDDFGGEHHVQATKDMMKFACSKANDFVDTDRCGYLTIGYGLVPTARALALYGMNTLKDVQYLVDVEGPTDRCAISAAAEDLAAGIGPDDGPGVSDTACNFGKESPHSKVYPPAKDGKPKSIICSESAWPITKTGKGCGDNLWWQVREPARSLKLIDQRYWRVQFLHDHRLPSYESSRTAMTAMVSSKSKFFALNLVAQCAKAPTDASCEGKNCWLSGEWGDHFAPGTYAGGSKTISIEDLLGKALPKYVLWVSDTKTVPNCKL